MRPCTTKIFNRSCCTIKNLHHELGKYRFLDETLSLLKPGGIYVIDDMLPQPNWPEGHDQKATALIADLEKRSDLRLVKMSWASGIILATKL